MIKPQYRHGAAWLVLEFHSAGTGVSLGFHRSITRVGWCMDLIDGFACFLYAISFLLYIGKVVYHIGFTNKEYRMSDIKTSKTQTETYNTGLYHEDIVPVYSYDKVTVFYDEKGKKIFEFGLDYDNVERLKADVKNTQKSILKHHSKN